MNGKLPIDSFFSPDSFRIPSADEHMLDIISINNMLISMFADEEIPPNLKPELWGEVRKDTLTEQQFELFLKSPSRVVRWLRDNFTSLVSAAIIGDDRKAKTEYLPKIAVYFEVTNGHIIMQPIGFKLSGGNIFKCGERADREQCHMLLEQFVFFGPDAKYASTMTNDALEALKHLQNNFWELMSPPLGLLTDIINDSHAIISNRNQYIARASVLAPVLNLAVASLSDPAKRQDVSKWILSEKVRDAEAFDCACEMLSIRIRSLDSGIAVHYM